jgi:hypothetical protein
VVGLDPPRPAFPTTSPAPPGRPVAPGDEKTYRVGRGGELFLQVAQRAFNNLDRWTDIYKLNPRFNPREPIPEGTMLKLPRDAKVPADNAP